MRLIVERTEERRATRMHQMMERLHVDVLALIRLRDGDAYAEARSRCLRCDDSSICLLWLDKGGPDAGPDFCPNLEFFCACKIEALRSIAARRASLLAKSQSQGPDLSEAAARKAGCSAQL